MARSHPSASVHPYLTLACLTFLVKSSLLDHLDQGLMVARHSLSRLDCLALLVKTSTQISRTVNDSGTLSVISALQPHLGSLFIAALTSPGRTHLQQFLYRCCHCSSSALIIPSSPQASRLTQTNCQIPDDMKIPPWSSWTPCRLDKTSTDARQLMDLHAPSL